MCWLRRSIKVKEGSQLLFCHSLLFRWKVSLNMGQFLPLQQWPSNRSILYLILSTICLVNSHKTDCFTLWWLQYTMQILHVLRTRALSNVGWNINSLNHRTKFNDYYLKFTQCNKIWRLEWVNFSRLLGKFTQCCSSLPNNLDCWYLIQRWTKFSQQDLQFECSS